MKKRFFIYAALIALSFNSCSQSPQRKVPNQMENEQKTLRVNLSDDPESLDPRMVRMLRDLTVVKQLFDGLMRLDQEGKPVFAVAQDCTISDDLSTYTFKLRDCYWSNGEKVTAHDFVYAWSKILDPSFRSDYSYMLYPIKNAKSIREGKLSVEALGVLAVDDYTLAVQLEMPTPYFLELTAFPTYFPINRCLDIRNSDWSGKAEYFTGNGPFVIDHWNSRKQLVLKKNPFYWDKNSVKLDVIELSMLQDANTEAELFDKNELDWMGQPFSHTISTDMIPFLKKEGKLHSFPVAGTLWYKFNTNEFPFNDVKVRRAFSYAINREELITHILQGHQKVATSPVPGYMTFREEQFFKDADIESARSLFNEFLEEKQLTKDTFPEIVLYHSPSERSCKLAQVIQQQWINAFNIPIKLEALETKVYREKTKHGQYQVAGGEWIADFNDPIAFLEIFKYRNDPLTGSGLNDTGWQNERYVHLLEESKFEKDPIKRLQILQEAEKILVDEMPIAPVYHYSFDYVKKDNVKNVMLSPLGIADFKYAEIYR